MSTNQTEAIFTSLQPFTYYRIADVSHQTNLPKSTVGKALRELARGGVVERFKEKRRVVYLTRQSSLLSPDSTPAAG